MSKKFASLIFSYFLFTFLSGLAFAAETEKITVEAEGVGETKMAALKDAWTNAVRQAVGAYLASAQSVKSDGLDDKYTEDIAAYSRGQINSFETISENQENGLWHIKIRANVVKDILLETVKEATNKSVKIEGANLAAQMQTTQEKKTKCQRSFEDLGPVKFPKLPGIRAFYCNI